MTLYENMPSDVRQMVDDVVGEIRSEPWSNKFLVLIGLLGDRLEACPDADPAFLLLQWTGVVTATLEQLPLDKSVMECMALMSISFNDQWRAQAIDLLERDPTLADRMASTYPSWEDIVEDVAEAHRIHPLRKAMHS
jgi:coenzyme F420-reducing hydrogenase beta subunit